MNLLKNPKHCFIFPLAGILFLGGVGRHDTHLNKYYQFAKDSVFNCIGEIYLTKKNEFALSCVLIDDRHILTSAHGLYLESDSLVNDSITVLNKRYPVERPAYTTLFNNTQFYMRFNRRSFYPKKITIHPEYDDDFNSEGNNDIAIVELAESISFIKPAVLYEEFNEKNARGIACGFGAISKAMGSNIRITKRKKMGGENIIDSVGGYKINGQWGALFADMDHPSFPYCNRMGSAQPLPLEWRSEGGDCGSGLFILNNNQWQLAGISFGPSYFADWKIYSKKYGYYGFIDGWTRISPLVEWISSVTKDK